MNEMTGLVGTIFDCFNIVITKMADGVKLAFVHILYEDPDAAEKVISDPVKFFFILSGLGLATGLVMGAFRWLRGRRGV